MSVLFLGEAPQEAFINAAIYFCAHRSFHTHSEKCKTLQLLILFLQSILLLLSNLFQEENTLFGSYILL